MCLLITAICFWNMDTIESWYSEANTWHPLVWISYERGSLHPLTGAVHKWYYKSEETLFLWPHQACGSGCSCPPSPTSTTRSSAKMLDEAGHHKHRALSSWCLEWYDLSVSMEVATTRFQRKFWRHLTIDFKLTQAVWMYVSSENGPDHVKIDQ